MEGGLTEIVVDVQGVGYALSVPLSTSSQLLSIGEKVTLYTHLSVREDALQLFGFLTKQERMLFQTLINAVSGVGAKLALNVLSELEVDSFLAAVAAGDVKLLSKINGIGKKTAERIIVELKDKLPTLAPNGVAPEQMGGSPAQGVRQEQTDALAALATLGFSPEAAATAVKAVLAEQPGATPSAEQLIRLALQRLCQQP